MSDEQRILDITILSKEVQELKDALLRHIIGQERAVDQFVKVYQQASVGMTREGRPLATFLFTGPTGVGKTEVVRCAAQFLLNNKDAVTRIDCGEFQHSHETAKLIGSPPGYVGYAEKKSVRLSQENIDRFQTKTNKINLILFDEIEEAHESILAAILQILDAGRLTLGTGDTTDFSRSIIVLTSNLGEKEMQNTLLGTTLGLAPPKEEGEKTDAGLYKTAKTAAVKYFHAKFMNRIDRIVVFRSLSEESLRQILDNELLKLEMRVWHSASKDWKVEDGLPVPQLRVYFHYSDTAKDFLIKEGTSKVYGARELNRAIDRFAAFPIGTLIGSKQIHHGDMVEVNHEDSSKELTFAIVGHKDLRVDVPPEGFPVGPGAGALPPAMLPPAYDQPFYIRPRGPSPPPRKPVNRKYDKQDYCGWRGIRE